MLTQTSFADKLWALLATTAANTSVLTFQVNILFDFPDILDYGVCFIMAGNSHLVVAQFRSVPDLIGKKSQLAELI